MSKKLVKELNKVHEKSVKNKSGDVILEDVKQLLLEAHNDDLQVLNRIGLDHQIKYSKELQIDAKRSELAQQKYDKIAYSGKEIKELCNTYDLRMLKASAYNGSIPVDLTRKVKEFERDNDLIIKSNSLYILAPTEQFKTIKHVPVKADPILFFKVDSENTISSYYDEASIEDKFVSVHNWGNDFTFLRKYRWLFSGYVRNSACVSNFITSLILIGIITLGIFINMYMTNKALTLFNFLLFFGISLCLVLNYVTKLAYLDKLWNTNEI